VFGLRIRVDDCIAADGSRDRLRNGGGFGRLGFLGLLGFGLALNFICGRFYSNDSP
jgi:hypothetical protein